MMTDPVNQIETGISDAENAVKSEVVADVAAAWGIPAKALAWAKSHRADLIGAAFVLVLVFLLWKMI